VTWPRQIDRERTLEETEGLCHREEFPGSLERLHNRGGGLRSEVRTQPDSLASVYALLRGGVTAYNVLQGVFMITQHFEALTAAVREQSPGIQELGGIFRALLDRIDRLGPRGLTRDGGGEPSLTTFSQH